MVRDLGKDRKGDEGRVKGVRKGVWVGMVTLMGFYIALSFLTHRVLLHIMLDSLHNWFNM